jgi:hypothetical protein
MRLTMLAALEEASLEVEPLNGGLLPLFRTTYAPGGLRDDELEGGSIASFSAPWTLLPVEPRSYSSALPAGETTRYKIDVGVVSSL